MLLKSTNQSALYFMYDNTYIYIYIYIYWVGSNSSFECPMCLTTLKSCDTTKLSVDDNIYTPQQGLSTLVKEFTAATHIMQSS